MSPFEIPVSLPPQIDSAQKKYARTLANPIPGQPTRKYAPLTLKLAVQVGLELLDDHLNETRIDQCEQHIEAADFGLTESATLIAALCRSFRS